MADSLARNSARGAAPRVDGNQLVLDGAVPRDLPIERLRTRARDPSPRAVLEEQ